MVIRRQTDFRGIHDDCWDKVEEDVIAVCADAGVTEGNLQLIHGLQQKTFTFILKVFKRRFLKRGINGIKLRSCH